MPKIQIAGREISYRVRKTDTKHAGLKLSQDLGLQVLLPRSLHFDPKTILHKKRKWILSKYDELVNRKRVFDGHSLLYRGRYYKVDVLQGARKHGPVVTVRNGGMTVRAAGTTDYLNLLKRWLAQQTRRIAETKVHPQAAKLGVTPRALHVRDTNRWAYCTKKGDLIFNWQLSSLPAKLAEYVVAHEVAHLYDFTHSRKFRSALAALCPDYRDQQRMLKTIVPARF